MYIVWEGYIILGINKITTRLNFENIDLKTHTTKRTRVRVFTFQSKEVLYSILRNGKHEVDFSKCRERRDYKLEKVNYKYNNVIWCFHPRGFRTKIPGKFSREDFKNGNIFERCRSEMSINEPTEMNNFYLLELEYYDDECKLGLTHNTFEGSVVVNSLRLENLISINRVEYDNENNWYKPRVINIKSFTSEGIFIY